MTTKTDNSVTYRGYTITVDGDGCLIDLPDADDYGTDPIEMMGTVEEAKVLVDEIVRDLRDYRGSDRERFGSDL